MTTFGLTAEGFLPKDLATVRAEIEADFQDAFGASINLSPRSFFGQFSGIMSEREANLWELSQAVYRAFDPDGATDDALDALSQLTGTLREGATNSLVDLTCVGTPGTLLSAGRIVSVEEVGTRFVTTVDATIIAATAWTISTAYTLGQYVTNSGKVYVCITAGTSAGSGGPTTTADDITDGTVHWRHLGTGTGVVDVVTEAEDTGPIEAVAFTLNVIETPVGGWATAINLLDATPGQDIESDAALRIRRANEVTGEGNATVDAIRAGVLRRVPETTTVTVFENTTDSTDGDGLPPHSVEVLVRGGDDQDIFEAVFAEVAAGIATHGTESGTVVDSSGNSHTVKFSRPTEIDVYVIAEVLRVTATFPSDGSDQIKAALVALGDAYDIGKDVYARALIPAVFGIAGVLNVSAMKIGTAPTPTTENTITVTSRQLAVFDTSRITVTLSAGTP